MRNVKLWWMGVACACAVAASSVALARAPAPARVAAWVFPAVAGYGGVHPRKDVAVRPDPGADYKVIVDVVHGAGKPDQVPASLQRLARLVNLMAYAGVPRSHVHIVAVLEAHATLSALNDAAYRRRYRTDNPSRALLHALKQAGVRLMVCSQALAKMHLDDEAIDPDVTVTLSALTDFAVYGQRGYSYMQL